MIYEVKTQDAEYTFLSLPFAYDRFDLEEHAVLTQYGYVDGEYVDEIVIDEK